MKNSCNPDFFIEKKTFSFSTNECIFLFLIEKNENNFILVHTIIFKNSMVLCMKEKLEFVWYYRNSCFSKYFLLGNALK